MQNSDVADDAVRVQDQLREAILTGGLEPGARLRAEALAERLRSSRTPVREALLLLAREGLVEIEPRRGATVRAFDAADVSELYEVRALIEPHAAGLAAERITADELGRLLEAIERSLAHDACDEASCGADGAQRGVPPVDPRCGAIGASDLGDGRGGRRSVVVSLLVLARRRPARAIAVMPSGAHGAIRAGRPELAETVMRMHIEGAGAFLAEVMAGEC